MSSTSLFHIFQPLDENTCCNMWFLLALFKTKGFLLLLVGLNLAALRVGVQPESGLFGVLCASLNNAAKCQLFLDYLLPGTLQ